MTKDITLDVALPHPVDRVWRALTDPDALAVWLMPVENFAPVVGREFTVHAKPMPGWDGVVHCAVTEVDEPHTLAYTWRGSKMRTATTVTWRLSTLDDFGTRLRLEHNGFTGLAGAVLAFMHKGGWKKMTHTKLADHLAKATSV